MSKGFVDCALDLLRPSMSGLLSAALWVLPPASSVKDKFVQISISPDAAFASPSPKPVVERLRLHGVLARDANGELLGCADENLKYMQQVRNGSTLIAFTR